MAHDTRHAPTGLDAFNRNSRPAIVKELSSTEFDLLVAGGGITGASVFRDAVLRGMKTALVDAGDFAAGTSGASSQLIHGGLRYIKTLDLGVVWESCHERDLQLRLNPALVKPMRFLIPVYEGQPKATLRALLFLYEALSGFTTRKHRFIDAKETADLVPGLETAGLRGGCLYWDASTDDVRFTLETIKDAVARGGTALNHAAVTHFVKQDRMLAGAVVKDAPTGTSVTIKARCVVNATGPSTDVLRRLDDPRARPLIMLSRGTHLVFAAKDLPIKTTVTFRSPLDNRQLFLIKHGDNVVYGTTDVHSTGDPLAPRPHDDTSYLRGSLAGLLPGRRLPHHTFYSGYRPLVRSGKDVGRTSRQERIDISRTGLITLTGGKLTTARMMAERAVNIVASRVPGTWHACDTAQRPLAGGVKQAPTDIPTICATEMPCTVDDVIRRSSYRWRADALERLPLNAVCKRLGIGKQECARQVRDARLRIKDMTGH